jgi:hypothetical protein
VPGVTGGIGAAPARLRPVGDQMRRDAPAGELRAPCHAADVIGSVARRKAVAATGGSLAGIAFRIAPGLTRARITGAPTGRPGDASAMADFLPFDAARRSACQGIGADGGRGRAQAKA